MIGMWATCGYRTFTNVIDLVPPKVQLEGLQIKGTLPPELSMISSLTEILLGDNLLSGNIPHDYDKLSLLNTLSFHHNLFEGPIPDFVWEFSDMVYLDLAYNFFSGTIPDTVHLTEPNLQVLNAENNDIAGSIPPTFASIDWHQLHLNGNNFSGPVPSGLISPDMDELYLHNNRLTGAFPTETYTSGYSSNLKEVTLYNNEITGDLSGMCNLMLNGALEVFEADIANAGVTCGCCSSGPL